MEEIFELVGIYQYSSEAIIFKGKLESEGIEVYMKDNYTIEANPLYSNAIGGIKLFVAKKDFSKANEIITQISKFSFDDLNELMKCPKCDTPQINMVTSIRDVKSLLVYFFFNINWIYSVLFKT